jgi:TupA-like ATPgrasp
MRPSQALMAFPIVYNTITKDAPTLMLRSRPAKFVRDKLPDRVLISLQYLKTFHKPLHLAKPRTFTEKLQWLKLYYRLPILTQFADKYESRFLAAQRLGTHCLTDLYGVWDQVEQIDFAKLPNSFVLKITAASAANIFCRDKSKLNLDETRAALSSLIKKNHYLGAREWPYRNIKPRIIAEQFMLDKSGRNPQDFKFFCFDGIPHYVQVDTRCGARHARNFFTMDFEPAPFQIGPYASSLEEISKPAQFEEMASYASILTRGFPFARADFYQFNGRAIFGEVDWYPDAGLHIFYPESYDEVLGKLLHLPVEAVSPNSTSTGSSPSAVGAIQT